MKFVKNLLFWLIALIVFFVALLAAVDNSAEVALTFVDWTSPELPLSWWVLGAFVLGALFAMLINLWTNTRLRLKARSASREVVKANKNLDKAKAEADTSAHVPQS